MDPKRLSGLALVLSCELLSIHAAETTLFQIAEIENPAGFERVVVKIGFIDQAGKIIIPPNTNWSLNSTMFGSKHFVEGMEPAQTRWHPGMTNGLKWGYLNTEGQFAIAPQFTLATPFSEGLAAVRDRFYGYIDRTGKFVIPPQFEEAYGFSEGLAQVGDTNHWMGFIDRSGKWVITRRYPAFSPHSNFSEGLACIATNCSPTNDALNTHFKWGYINKKGEQVIGFNFDEANAFSEGLAAVGEDLEADNVDKKTGGHLISRPFSKSGYIDKTGKYVIPPQFDGAWSFSEGLARVRIQGQMKFINQQGKIMFSVPNGDWTDGFSDGLANVSIREGVGEGIWGYINRSGRFVIKPQFQQAKPFYHGLAQVVVNSKMAYIDRSGHYVWKQP